MATLENKRSLNYFSQITDGFSDQRLLGKGLYASVYTGKLDDGTVVAVKKLDLLAPVPDKDKFCNQIEIMKLLEHENIVKLVSSCRESVVKPVSNNGTCTTTEVTETVLCYEYFPRGSLDKHIFGDSTLGWDKRFEIIKGISKGIEYLHSRCPPVWHLGLKPQNILLDDKMVPKIADFFFSRIFESEDTKRFTQSRVGTAGYMAPEYVVYNEISARSDIYSLGLIILEIVTREKNSSAIDSEHAEAYIDKVLNTWDDDKILEVYDDELDADGISQVTECIEIGKECVNSNQRARPCIQDIVRRLSAH